DVFSNFAKIVGDAATLKAAGFPYERCLIFLNSFISFVSYIVHKAVVQDEIDFYTDFDLQKNIQPAFNKTNANFTSYANYLRDRRNNIDGCRSTAQSEYGMLAGHDFHSANKSAPFFAVLGSAFSFYK